MKIHHLKMHHESNSPIEVVWEVFNSHAEYGKIMGQSMTRITDSTDPDNVNGVNSVRKINIPLMPFEETIVRSIKPHRIEYRISKGGPLAHHYGIMVLVN